MAHNAPGARQPVVLQLLPALESGGVERGTLDIAAAITRAGFSSLVVSSGGKMVAELEAQGARHIQLPIHIKSPSHILDNAERLARLIEEHNVSLVHARSRAPAWAGHFACQRTGRPFITTFHGTYSTSNPLIRKYNSVMVSGQCVIAVSDFIADHISEHYDVPRERLEVIHRGINLEQYDPQHVNAARVDALRRQWQVSAGKRIVLLPGRLTWLKGQYVLIQAMAHLPADTICVLAGGEYGGTSYTQTLMRLAQRRGVEQRVCFAGECADMPAAYMLADAVVSASVVPEAFGRVLAEAQAMGKPVISTDFGGGKEIIEDCQAGWLVQSRNAEALAMGISQALGLSPAELSRMRERGMRRSRNLYDMSRMCTRTLDVYRAQLAKSLAGKAQAAVS